MQDILTKAAKIRLVIFDVDGVLTDGSLFYGDDGQEYKAFNSKDGHGMVMLRDCGIRIGIITGRSSEVVRIRMASLGVEQVYQGQKDKLPAYEQMKSDLGLTDEQVAYVGDDVVDLPVMSRVGLSIAVADAHELVCEKADWRTLAGGGKGAAREVCELLMRAQGLYDGQMRHYLS
ncbi:MAG: 3-deoxy-D-manno-octulosonate 8-phosphate phosphatase [Gammaproteobacteria bacterium RIFOXYA12_FULL_61_12]|nr:MAG: 3-deoxy-D-manno-octulosonate 8-phosphate phosphatase [Gammaproteobacteria bacterium RIFOXYD12_FULL_61_37]OGT93143.1 MAG: 3-deoxy-D-manno-octulosonate 8-phosphate phosphatase [Gammaproteobacteria bacterium RIFOXYA12_FULL_61_12]